SLCAGEDIPEECKNDTQGAGKRNGGACALGDSIYEIFSEIIMYSTERMKYKGPPPKSGRHHTLVQRISLLILEHKYSPYAVLQHLEEEDLWPEGLRICEKTL
ncbi:MAG: hypothetical protein WC159_01020, partial [Sphaerochaetaceae bacterium]